jgi:hypothetical protein
LRDKCFLREAGGLVPRAAPVDERHRRRGGWWDEVWGGRGHCFIMRGIFGAVQLRALQLGGLRLALSYD